MVLSWPGGVATPLTSMLTVLVSVVQQGTSGLFPCVRILSCCLIHEKLLIVLVMGSEVRNNLCCHLGSITPKQQIFLRPLAGGSSTGNNGGGGSLKKMMPGSNTRTY